MRNFFSRIFCKGKIETLENEISDLKEKIKENQEVINQTNAYWKRKMYAVKKESKRGGSL
jgi:peptidoglycan hydrolase CwlO-like protein